jgi:hypothetical protein
MIGKTNGQLCLCCRTVRGYWDGRQGNSLIGRLSRIDRSLGL